MIKVSQHEKFIKNKLKYEYSNEEKKDKGDKELTFKNYFSYRVLVKMKKNQKTGNQLSSTKHLKTMLKKECSSG